MEHVQLKKIFYSNEAFELKLVTVKMLANLKREE